MEVIIAERKAMAAKYEGERAVAEKALEDKIQEMRQVSEPLYSSAPNML